MDIVFSVFQSRKTNFHTGKKKKKSRRWKWKKYYTCWWELHLYNSSVLQQWPRRFAKVAQFVSRGDFPIFAADFITVELKRGGGTSSSTVPPVAGPQGTAAQFTVEELEQATKNFHESNLIGYGSFGLVYKGLLRDGNFVVIKRRTGAPSQEFIEEVW